MYEKYRHVAGLCLMLLMACESTELAYFPCPEGVRCPGDPDAGAVDAAADGGAGEQGWVGGACADNETCTPGTCVTNETLASMGLVSDAIDIPNGICSRLACVGDDQCGPGGICFDTRPFSGAPISICLRSCTKMAECRWTEGYACDLLPPVEGEANPEAGACLPDSIIVAIECDDGSCDEE